MKFRRELKIVPLLAAGLILAACSQPSGTDTQQPKSNNQITVSVGLGDRSFSTQTVSPLGSPYDDDGVAVQSVTVEVYSGPDAVHFEFENGTYTAVDGPGITELKLSRTNPSVSVVLYDLGNPYTFEAFGEGGGETIAYAYQTQNVSENGTVLLELDSVLGTAELDLRLLTHYALPDQEIDLMLNVFANGTDFRVPMADFDFEYEVTNADLIEESGRGLRIKVDSDCTSSITVEAVVTGWVMNVSDEIEADGEIETVWTIPCATTISGGGLILDLENPTITFNVNGAIVSGTVDDNFGIDEIQVWDGPVMLASTAPTHPNHKIINTDSSGNFEVTLDAVVGGVNVIAYDTSGNQTDSSDSVNPMFLFVDADATGGDGSRSNPFGSIRAAVQAVAPGGTVFMFDGHHYYDDGFKGEPEIMNIDGVTLRGESTEHTVLVPRKNSTESHIMTNYGLLVNNADDVTFEHFTIDASQLVWDSSSTNRIIAIQLAERFTMRDVVVLGNLDVAAAGMTGLAFTSVKDVILDDVEIHDVNGRAIRLKAVENIVLSDVTIAGSAIGLNIETKSTHPADADFNESRFYIDHGITWDGNSNDLTIIHHMSTVTDVNLSGFTHAVRQDAFGVCDSNVAGPGFTYYYFRSSADAADFVTTACAGVGYVYTPLDADLASIVGVTY